MGLSGPPDDKKIRAKKDLDALMTSLLDALEQSDLQEAAAALDKIGSLPRGLKSLSAAIWMRQGPSAASALGEIGGPHAVKVLSAALKMRRRSSSEDDWDEDWELRKAAAKALGQTRDPGAVEPLITVLLDEDFEFIRDAAADALVLIGAPAVVPLSVALMRFPHRSATIESILDRLPSAVTKCPHCGKAMGGVAAAQMLSKMIPYWAISCPHCGDTIGR